MVGLLSGPLRAGRKGNDKSGRQSLCRVHVYGRLGEQEGSDHVRVGGNGGDAPQGDADRGRDLEERGEDERLFTMDKG